MPWLPAWLVPGPVGAGRMRGSLPLLPMLWRISSKPMSDLLTCPNPAIASAARMTVARQSVHLGCVAKAGLVRLEILRRALVLLCGSAGLERSEIAPPAGLRVELARIEAVAAGLK